MGNKINAPAFMIASNPMSAKQVFIIHTGTPFVMAEVHHFHYEDESEILKCQQQYSIGGKTTLEPATAVIGAVLMVPDEKFGTYTAQEQADKLASLMRRMSDWYYAFLKWDDKNNKK